MNPAKLLKEAGISYEKDDTGSLNITVSINDDERSQLVVIDRNVDEFNGVKILEIWSKAADMDEVSEKYYIKLLKRNSTTVIGSWQVADDSLIFCAKVPLESLTSEDLDAIIDAVAIEADNVEKRFSDEDFF
ncbi:hypothetical protein IJT93_07930 [bacterium]|nr:hypothetical protein [bacterium]